MTPGARVAATIELLDEIVSQSDRPADLVANAFFRARRFIGGGDRRAVADRVWGILRRYGQLSWWLNRTRAERSARTFVAADLLLVEGLAFNDMQALFDGGRYRPPPLEESEKEVAGHQPTLRESLAKHREDALCRSCHNRMDPLGLALENFNALGMWRDQERRQPIDAGGRLITGETFSDVRELKRVLVTKHRHDFYHCLAEKFLTYALGRGVEHYDIETLDQIVARLEKENGKFSALLEGVIQSAPFQKRRNISSTSAALAPSETRAQTASTP